MSLLLKLFGRYLRPGLLRARFARLLLRNELNPAYPNRGNFKLNYVFCEVFGSDFCCLFNLGDAFGPGSFGLAVARLLLRNELNPTYPYRGFDLILIYV